MVLLLRLSASGPGSIPRLSEYSSVSRQAITKHLDVLSAAHLVRDVRRGRERIWELEPKRLGDAHEYLEQISRHWDEALVRLRLFVEATPADELGTEPGPAKLTTGP